MYKAGVKLNNEDGTFRCYITQGEARRGVQGKQMRRLRLANCPLPIYQLVKYPGPSTSRNDKTSIYERDLRLVIGMQRICNPHDDKNLDREQKDLERLIGFGLLAENAQLPASGYL